MDTLTSSPQSLSESEVASLGRAAGIPLAAYRRPHVERCVRRAAVRSGCSDSSGLAETLRRDNQARTTFRRSVLVPVTSMFRDREEFDALERELMPGLHRRPRPAVWSAGCSSGEELRSVAVLLERLGGIQGAYLLGTDVLDDALAAARPSPMPAGAVVRFERRDLLLDDAPERTFDLVLCRNVAIYLERPVQETVHRKLVSALRTGGLLMLGRSETLLRAENLGLEQVTRHIFRKTHL